MSLAWGVVVTALSLLAWIGQAVSWRRPATAVRLQLMEAEDDVEPTFWADMRGEAVWDTFTLWTMVVAGVLLIAGSDTWAYFGLVGGGMYLYFAGRGILTRIVMMRYGLRVGAPGSVRTGLIALFLWGAMAIATIVAATISLAA